METSTNYGDKAFYANVDEQSYEVKEGILDRCKCGKYKESEYISCLECYRKSKNNFENRKKYKINDNSIKGKLAEAIIEELLISLGFRVFRFGMENTVPGFGDRFLPRTGVVAEQIRKMPDFIIVKESTIAYVEVKYRTNGEFNFKEDFKGMGKYPYPNALFILVSPSHIKIQQAENLEAGKSFIYLADHEYFKEDRDIILQHIHFCKKFFGNC